MNKIYIHEFVASSCVNELMTRKIISQFMGWKFFKKHVKLISSYKVNGVPKIPLLVNTYDFFLRNRIDIIFALSELRGKQKSIKSDSIIEFVRCEINNKNIIRRNVIKSLDDKIAITLYGPKNKIFADIADYIFWIVGSTIAECLIRADDGYAIFSDPILTKKSGEIYLVYNNKEYQDKKECKKINPKIRLVYDNGKTENKATIC